MIDLLVPTRHRPQRIRILLQSIVDTADNLDAVHVYMYVDEDDDIMGSEIAAIQREFPFTTYQRGDRICLSKMWNSLWSISTGDICMHAGDDIVFESPHWDTLVEQAFAAVPDRILLVYGDDYIQHAKIATHSFTHRNAHKVWGYFVPPYFVSDYNDTWLTEVYRKLGRMKYIQDIITHHYHFRANPEFTDDVYLDARERAPEAVAKWQETAVLRQQDIEKLRQYIDTFTKENNR